MYKRIAAILLPILAVVAIGAGVWGYQENKEKNAILIKAENQYQRAFHDLTYNIEALHNELGKTRVITSDVSYRKCLTNVWRLSNLALNDINQLPLTLMPFSKTEEFLSKISNFSYRTSVRDLSKSPLTDGEKKVLQTLYERSTDIKNELRGVQSKVLSKNLRWMDVELALATEDKKLDNTIIDGFKTIEKTVNEYSEVQWGPSMPDVADKKNFTTKNLAGSNLSKEQIRKRAADFLGIRDLASIKVVENGKGTEFASYSVTAPRKADGSENEVQMDLTKKGGHIIWMMDNRPVETRKLNLSQAQTKAEQFLQQKGYRNMEAVSYDEYGNVAAFIFASVVNNVLIYPEKITVKVALDNGEVLGLQASDYIFSHHSRNIGTPALSLDEAKQSLNPDFQVTESRLALIENDMKKEVLTYEFVGRMGNAIYRAYINAEDGIEETIEKLSAEDAQVKGS